MRGAIGKLERWYSSSKGRPLIAIITGELIGEVELRDDVGGRSDHYGHDQQEE